MIWFNEEDDDNFYVGNEKHIQFEMEFIELFDNENVAKAFLSKVSEYYINGKLKRETNYTENGEIESEIQLDKDPAKYFYSTSDVVTDNNDNLISMITYYKNNSYLVDKYLYDEKNKIVGSLRFSNNGEIRLYTKREAKLRNTIIEDFIYLNGTTEKKYSNRIESKLFEKITIHEKNDKLFRARFIRIDLTNQNRESFSLRCKEDYDEFEHVIYDEVEKEEISNMYVDNKLQKREVSIFEYDNFTDEKTKFYEMIGGKLALKKIKYYKREYYE